MFSFLKKDRPELFAIFDIGSSSVGAALVKHFIDRPPTVVYTVRETIPYRDDVTPDRLLDDMIRALSIAHDRIHRDGLAHLKFTEFGGHRIRRAFYTFSSPWSASQTKSVRITYQQSTVITRELVEKIVRDAEQAFEAQVIDPSNDPKFKEKLTLVDRQMIDIRLNGYEVSNPYGKEATELSVSFFISLVPTLVIDRVSSASFGAFHPKELHFSSSQLAVYSVLRDVTGATSDSIILDVGGEVSDVAVIKSGLILETASFPLGKNFLVRRVSRALSVTYEGALSLLRLYFSDHADKEVSESLRPVLENASREWQGALHTTLSRISGTLSLPQELIAIVGGDLVAFFMRALREERITQFDVLDVPFRITLVNHDLLRKAVSFAPKATKDPSLALIAVFANHQYTNNIR